MSYKIQQGQIQSPSQSIPKPQGKPSGDFQRLYLESLQKLKEPVKVSAHAKVRMDQRDIALSADDLDKINSAVDQLEKKGAKESLLLYKDAAFIASVQNRTIITAMKDAEIDTVTNIDSLMKIK